MACFEIVVVIFIQVDENIRKAFDDFLQYPSSQAEKIWTRWAELQSEQRASWVVELKWSTVQSLWDSYLGDFFMWVYIVCKAGGRVSSDQVCRVEGTRNNLAGSTNMVGAVPVLQEDRTAIQRDTDRL